jgi:hypothetical protein
VDDPPVSSPKAKAGRQPRAASSSPIRARGGGGGSSRSRGSSRAGADSLMAVSEEGPSPFELAAAQAGGFLTPTGSLVGPGALGGAGMDRAVSLPASLSVRERMALKRKSKLGRNDSMAASLSYPLPGAVVSAAGAAAANGVAATTEAGSGTQPEPGSGSTGAAPVAAAAAAQEAVEAEQDEAEVRPAPGSVWKGWCQRLVSAVRLLPRRCMHAGKVLQLVGARGEANAGLVAAYPHHTSFPPSASHRSVARGGGRRVAVPAAGRGAGSAAG